MPRARQGAQALADGLAHAVGGGDDRRFGEGKLAIKTALDHVIEVLRRIGDVSHHLSVCAARVQRPIVDVDLRVDAGVPGNECVATLVNVGEVASLPRPVLRQSSFADPSTPRNFTFLEQLGVTSCLATTMFDDS